ncbi:MAG: glycosyltransferase [Coriobacteriia bacterium]|nr:glycosyltransferase [Coriobacteriia bacterium]
MSDGDAGRLAGTRVCILRRGSIAHDKRTQQIARLLVEAGAKVTVVCTARTGREDWMETSGYSVIEVAGIPAFTHPVWLIRVVSNLIRNRLRAHAVRRAIVRTVRAFDPDIVHCMNVDMLYFAYRAAGARRYIYDSREHFATTGVSNRRTRLWWLLSERLLIPKAAAVFTVTDMIADDLERRYRISRPTVLVNGCTTRVIEAQPPHEPLRLIHQGKFFFDRHLDDVIRAVARQGGSATLTLQGWGEAEASLRQLVADLGIEASVTFVPPCPPEQVVASAADHDVGVINIWPENDSHRWTGSNKLFDYMGAGLAEIVTNLDFTRRVVEAEGIGMVFDPPDADRIAEVIGWLIDNPGEVARMKRNAVAASAHYTWEAQAGTLYDAYERALGRSPEPPDSPVPSGKASEPCE